MVLTRRRVFPKISGLLEKFWRCTRRNNGKTSLRFNSLDGLRGFAAISVAYLHIVGTSWGVYLAVDLFFILSGFVLTHAYEEKRKFITFRQFLAERIARLWPLHFLALLAVSFIFLLDVSVYYDENFSAIGFFYNLLLIHNIGAPGSVAGLSYNFPSWSISVEFL